MKHLKVLAGAVLFFMTACGRKEAPPEPPAQNAFTEHIEQGIHTMDRAQRVADKVNTQTQQQQSQAESVP